MASALPMVADLASAGGVQSYPLKDRASGIYCVDNSPGMVESVQEDEVIKGQFGEMTATGLQNNSMDLVFCVNAVEYLFWPEDLAEEVKRIAKPNARCLIAFPAREGCPLQAPVTPPDRIQHNFTRAEVEAWAKLIGPGEIIGIQHDAKEPADAEEALAYRELEEDQANITNPMFWVFRGEVARQDYCRETPGDSAGQCTFHPPEPEAGSDADALRSAHTNPGAGEAGCPEDPRSSGQDSGGVNGASDECKGEGRLG